MPKSKFPQPISGKRFTGVLLEPLESIDPLTFVVLTAGKPAVARARADAEAERHIKLQILERLFALAEHYGVDLANEGGEANLLFAVCQDFIIGFNYSDRIGNTRPGKKKGQTKFPNFEFWKAVRQIEDAKGHTVQTACTILSRQRGKAWSGVSPHALAVRYRRFDKKFKQDSTDALEQGSKADNVLNRIREAIKPMLERSKVNSRTRN